MKIEKGIPFEEVKNLPYGKGCLVNGSYKYHAMYVGGDNDEELVFISSTGARCRFKAKNYNKTWSVLKTI